MSVSVSVYETKMGNTGLIQDRAMMMMMITMMMMMTTTKTRTTATTTMMTMMMMMSTAYIKYLSRPLQNKAFYSIE